MNAFLHFVSDIIIIVESHQGLQVFTVSLAILLIGLIGEIYVYTVNTWPKTIKTKPLDFDKLAEYEKRHPQKPSFFSLVTVVVCTIALLMASIGMLRGIDPFNYTFGLVHLSIIFILMGTIGIMGEVKQKLSRDTQFGVIIGTAVAIAYVAVKFGLPQYVGLVKYASIGLILIAVAMAKMSLFKNWSQKLGSTTFLTFFFWFLLYV